MGPSGAGKSTLFDAIAGFVPLDAGEVRLDGRTLEAASGVRVGPQHRGVVLLGSSRASSRTCRRARTSRSGRAPAARGAARHGRMPMPGWIAWGWPAWAHDVPRSCPAGKQRVALARALATAPRVLLLDEPLTSLDPATAADIRALLRDQLAATGTTALIATHDAADAASLAGRLVVLEAGRITQEGGVREVLDAPATPFAAAVAATLPDRRGEGSGGGSGDGWAARIEDVRAGESGVVVRARTATGEDIVLELPAGAGAIPGGTITVSAGR
ncbi:ATP-binding cassette domain-containing protein [Microbacterium elymi]|uniref:ATP-binding cassette domain-containing protein n=1 Tax=Microbacterium elymi TaxID=2909587 RepID=UPI003F49AA6E